MPRHFMKCQILPDAYDMHIAREVCIAYCPNQHIARNMYTQSYLRVCEYLIMVSFKFNVNGGCLACRYELADE